MNDPFAMLNPLRNKLNPTPTPHAVSYLEENVNGALQVGIQGPFISNEFKLADVQPLNTYSMPQQNIPFSINDYTSLNFLASMGSGKHLVPSTAIEPQFRAPEPVSSAPAMNPLCLLFISSSPLDLSVLDETPMTTPTGYTTPMTGKNNSALAERLANGHRKTQEAQRSALNILSSAFSSPSTTPRISLKEMVGQTSKRAENAAQESHSDSLNDSFGSNKDSITLQSSKSTTNANLLW